MPGVIPENQSSDRLPRQRRVDDGGRVVIWNLGVNGSEVYLSQVELEWHAFACQVQLRRGFGLLAEWLGLTTGTCVQCN